VHKVLAERLRDIDMQICCWNTIKINNRGHWEEEREKEDSEHDAGDGRHVVDWGRCQLGHKQKHLDRRRLFAVRPETTSHCCLGLTMDDQLRRGSNFN
jgi:hypothetical protein